MFERNHATRRVRSCRARLQGTRPALLPILLQLIEYYCCRLWLEQSKFHSMTEETSKKTLHIDHCMWSIFFGLAFGGRKPIFK